MEASVSDTIRSMDALQSLKRSTSLLGIGWPLIEVKRAFPISTENKGREGGRGRGGASGVWVRLGENGDTCQPAVFRCWQSPAGKLESLQRVRPHLPTHLPKRTQSSHPGARLGLRHTRTMLPSGPQEKRSSLPPLLLTPRERAQSRENTLPR